MRSRTVLSLEQALSMPSATLRFAQLGWRVIRIEATKADGGLPGDPNRYIGSRVADEDRRSYFIAPNVGKEAIALNLTPTPHATAVYASCSASLPPHATLASRRPATALPGPDLHRLIAPASLAPSLIRSPCQRARGVPVAPLSQGPSRLSS